MNILIYIRSLDKYSFKYTYVRIDYMVKLPLFRAKPVPTPELPRDDTGKFAARSQKTSKQISQLAEDVRSILEVADEIRGLGGGADASDNDLLSMGLQFLMQQAQNNQNQLVQQPVMQHQEEEITPMLMEQIRDKWGMKLTLLKKSMPQSEFEILIELVKKFKKDDIIKLVYGSE